jgi:hypothetical protein
MHKFIEISSQSMQIIGDSVKNIVKDGKIELHDIPTILRIIIQIYHEKSIQNEMFIKENILIFVRFTFDSLLKSKFLLLPDVEKEIIEKMVDNSLDLLQYNINDLGIEEDCCEHLFTFWKK